MTYASKARRRALSLFERRRFLRIAAAAAQLRQRNASADERALRTAHGLYREDGAYDALEPSAR